MELTGSDRNLKTKEHYRYFSILRNIPALDKPEPLYLQQLDMLPWV